MIRWIVLFTCLFSMSVPAGPLRVSPVHAPIGGHAGDAPEGGRWPNCPYNIINNHQSYLADPVQFDDVPPDTDPPVWDLVNKPFIKKVVETVTAQMVPFDQYSRKHNRIMFRVDDTSDERGISHRTIPSPP